MYKILALNCLVSAYSLSVLTLQGIKFGEVQATVGGLAIAMYFAFLSFSKPLEKLSAERPHTSVFSAYMLLSIAGQFALHLYTIMAAVALAQPFAAGAAGAEAGSDAAAAAAEALSPDGKFAPSVLNSVVFLVGQSTTVATFAVNYSGRPFMQSLRENKALFRALAAVALLVAACALNVSHDLLELCELVPFPSDEVRNTVISHRLRNIQTSIVHHFDILFTNTLILAICVMSFYTHQFRMSLIQLLVVDALGAWAIESALRFVFRRMPSKSA
jgi:cation-transporting ATPase 13A1